jgi:chromate reductase, NAD(P)H dehydrogenase (quinone)
VILAVSGSLRRTSINSAVLRAAATAAAREGIMVTIDDHVRELSHFDADLEVAPPRAVLGFRKACESASGVLLSVPEYAFGIPGAFKNALDWTVGSGSLYGKAVTVLDVSAPRRGENVRAALGLVLTAVGADVVHRALPGAAAARDPDGEFTDPELIDELRTIVAELVGRGAAGPSHVLSHR